MSWHVTTDQDAVILSRASTEAISEGDSNLFAAASARADQLARGLERYRQTDAARLRIGYSVPRCAQVLDADGAVLYTAHCSPPTVAVDPWAEAVREAWAGYGFSEADRAAWRHLGLTVPAHAAELRAAGYSAERSETVDLLRCNTGDSTIGASLEDDAIDVRQALAIYEGQVAQ